MNKLEEAKALIQEFVDRVGKGEIRSHTTYNKFQEFLGSFEPDIVYYYESKPYRVLHEGKLKATSVLSKIDSIIGEPQDRLTENEFKELNTELGKNNIKWIDVVVYEPLYEECDIRICVKEKDDFYNNYKPRE